MIIALYILFAISVIAPIYTYVVYPVILKLLPAKKRYSIEECFTPLVSVIVRENGDKNATNDKLANLEKQSYPSDKYEIIKASECGSISEFNKAVDEANGEIIIISDTMTVYDYNSIQKLVKHFSDKRIGCVVGQLRKVDADGNEIDNGAFWKYENLVRKQESKLGAVSGANHSIYAFRKEMIKEIPQNIIDVDFYVSTCILQAGYDVIMEDEAVAYESPEDNEKQQFECHVHDGMGYYQAFGVFWKLLLPRKGSFVYVSHRVMKWLVPFNLLFLLISNVFLAFISTLFLILLILQIIFYLIQIAYYPVTVRKDRKPHGIVLKLLSLAFYFISVNSTLFIGFFRYISGKQKGTWETQR